MSMVYGMGHFVSESFWIAVVAVKERARRTSQTEQGGRLIEMFTHFHVFVNACTCIRATYLSDLKFQLGVWVKGTNLLIFSACCTFVSRSVLYSSSYVCGMNSLSFH